MSQKKFFPYGVLCLLVSYKLTQPVAARTCSQLCHYVPWARDADCSGRHLHQIPQECVGSKVLNLNRNNISEVPSLVFSSFNHLKYLQILGSSVHMVQANSFAGAKRLKSINLLLNDITILPAHSFNDTVSLKWVYLTGNQIAIIESGVFQEAPQIEMLYLDENQLDHLDEGVFEGLSKIQRLLLGGNKLRELSGNIFRDLTVLDFLDISRNQLTSLSRDTFRGLERLKTINLAGNGLTSIAPGSFSFNRISYLDISNNSLTTLAFDHQELAFLKEVKAGGNHWNCDCSLNEFRQALYGMLELSLKSNSGVLCEKPSTLADTDITSHSTLCVSYTSPFPDMTKMMKKSFQMKAHGTAQEGEEDTLIIAGYSPEIVTLVVVSCITFVALLAIGMFIFVVVFLPWFKVRRGKKEDIKAPVSKKEYEKVSQDV